MEGNSARRVERFLLGISTEILAWNLYDSLNSNSLQFYSISSSVSFITHEGTEILAWNHRNASCFSGAHRGRWIAGVSMRRGRDGCSMLCKGYWGGSCIGGKEATRDIEKRKRI